MWTGIPIITCPDDTFASRHALSHLSNAGLTETIAKDVAHYVELGVALARDRRRLASVRSGLRGRMSESLLCDLDRFTTNLVQTLRNTWRRRCAEDF